MKTTRTENVHFVLVFAMPILVFTNCMGSKESMDRKEEKEQQQPSKGRIIKRAVPSSSKTLSLQEACTSSQNVDSSQEQQAQVLLRQAVSTYMATMAVATENSLNQYIDAQGGVNVYLHEVGFGAANSANLANPNPADLGNNTLKLLQALLELNKGEVLTLSSTVKEHLRLHNKKEKEKAGTSKPKKETKSTVQLDKIAEDIVGEIEAVSNKIQQFDLIPFKNAVKKTENHTSKLINCCNNLIKQIDTLSKGSDTTALNSVMKHLDRDYKALTQAYEGYILSYKGLFKNTDNKQKKNKVMRSMRSM